MSIIMAVSTQHSALRDVIARPRLAVSYWLGRWALDREGPGSNTVRRYRHDIPREDINKSCPRSNRPVWVPEIRL